MADKELDAQNDKGWKELSGHKHSRKWDDKGGCLGVVLAVFALVAVLAQLP